MKRLGGGTAIRHARLVGLAVFLGALAPARLAAKQCPDGTPPPCTRRSAAAAPAPAPAATSVAVLYFDNLSRDTNDLYLADGLTEEIIARLGQVARLQVKSRNAVRRFRGDATSDPAALGRALGVTHLVSGGVRRSGDRLRVNVELTRASTGVRVWGQQFERASGDLFAIEEDVAREVTTAIAGRMLPAERVRLAERPTRNPAAHDRMLRGNFYLVARTPQSVRHAIEEYEAAAQLDPTYADPLARIAYGYALFLDWGWRMPGIGYDSMLALGIRSSDQALALDSASSDAWMSRGYLSAYRDPRTLAGMREAFERAIAHDPSNVEAYHQLGAKLQLLGEDSAAAVAMARALALDPDRAITLRNMGLLEARRHRFPEAIRWLDSAVTVDPAAAYARRDRALLRLTLGDTAGARLDIAAASSAIVPGLEQWGPALQAALLSAEGDAAPAHREAERIAHELDDARPHSYEFSYLAVAFLRAGDPVRALDALERFHPTGAALWGELRLPWFEPLRGNPRFDRLVAAARPPGAR